MQIMWAGSEWVIITPLTQEQIQEQCIHAWRDEVQPNGSILQTCVRCNLQRTISVQ